MSKKQMDVAIIGGGLIGTSLAYHLTKRGVRPWLFEAETLASQASHAGAGMLGAQVEMHEPGPLFELGVASRQEYAGLCESLKEETGIDPEYSAEGMVRIASDPEEAQELKARGEWQRQAGQRAEWWSPEDVRNALGYAAPPCEGALYLPDDHRVESPRLAKALARGAVQAGATIRQGEPVLRLEENSGGIELTTALDTYAVGTVVVAAGAWSPLLLQNSEWRGRIFPVKGEAVFLEAGLIPLRQTVFAKDVYLVPKKDGRIYLGATEERDTWSRQPSAAGIARLAARAGSRVPDLQDLPVSEVRVGLRPWSDDNLPYLGPVPGTRHLWIAAGHGRNGILLAPITGRLMAQWLVTGERDPLLDAFDPERIIRG